VYKKEGKRRTRNEETDERDERLDEEGNKQAFKTQKYTIFRGSMLTLGSRATIGCREKWGMPPGMPS